MGLYFLWRAIVSAAQASSMLCNGSPLLCSKLYNEVHYATSHNIQANRPNPLLSFLPGVAIHDQSQSVMHQLEDGIRAMKIPVHGYQQEVVTCHGMAPELREEIRDTLCKKLSFLEQSCHQALSTVDPCVLDPAKKPLKAFLLNLTQFLGQHPHEVLTLFVEDTTQNFDALHSIFEDAGLLSYTYHQDPERPWPTLREMIQSKKRLVIFVSHEFDHFRKKYAQYPEFNPKDVFFWESRYSFKHIFELEKDSPLESERRPIPANGLTILQHFTTPSLGGSIEDAKIANQVDFLRARENKYSKFLKRPINFIWVDFCNQADYGIYAYIRELNSQ